MRHIIVVKLEKGFYFRIFGHGISFDLDSPQLFGERYGYQRVLRIGRLAIRRLS